MPTLLLINFISEVHVVLVVLVHTILVPTIQPSILLALLLLRLAVESSKIEGKSLSEALSGTHIDLSSMQKLLGKEKMKDGEDDEEEEESEDTSEKESKKEDNSDDDSSKSEEKESEKDGRLNGRDKNGMYKNHKNYVNLRNKINEQESGHQKMFDSINDKLSDR
jgi:hypothetical protein